MTPVFKIVEAILFLITMVRPPFLVLHKTEWERLQQQGGPQPEEPEDTKKEYLKALTEQSQQWMKTWPDTVASQIALVEKQKKQQLNDNIAFMKAYAKKTKQNNTPGSIQEAKQLIFEDSSYGRKLISALLESRALEVRETQIKFRKKIQQKEAERAKELEKSESDAIKKFDEKNAERVKLKKLTALECNRVNKEMVSLKEEIELQMKLKEIQCAVEDEKLKKQVLAIEEKDREDIKRCKKQDNERYEAEKKEIEKLKIKERELDEALTEIYRKGQDRVKCKMHAVQLRRPDTKWSNDLYKHVDQIKKEEKKRYEDFINTGITKFEERTSEKEKKDRQREKEKKSSRYLISQKNKIAGEERLAKVCANKYDCDRLSLILKTNRNPKKTVVITNDNNKNNEKKMKNTEIRTDDQSKITKIKAEQISEKTSTCNEKYGDEKEVKLLFLAPRKELMEELKKREKEPSPWNAARGAHEHFAQQANRVLKEVKYKHFARKVVDEYRKFNCLDATTLPVSNY